MHEGSCPEITQERTGVGFAVSKKGKQPMTGRFPEGGLNEKGPCYCRAVEVLVQPLPLVL